MTGFSALPVAASLVGESPFWHPDEAVLYWCDIAGKALHRFAPATAAHTQWALDSEPCCCAPLPGGGVLIARRDGIVRFDPQAGTVQHLAEPPYKPSQERFNDGKCDPQGRLWVSTLYEPRDAPKAALYRWAADGDVIGTGTSNGTRTGTGTGHLQRMAGDITNGNGLAFSPDGRTLYWSDTTSHRIFAFDCDGGQGTLSRQRVFAAFPTKQPGQDLAGYGGRPDGAAVDSEGAYWVAMFEGQRLLRLAPDGSLLQDLPLPVRCPTMPCFGGADLRTLFITTASDKRPAAELAAQPLAGRVLVTRVAVPGLPVNFARG